MKLKKRAMRRIAVKSSLAMVLALSSAFVTPQAFAQSDGHLITMKDADIKAFIEDVSVVTGKTFIIDPRIQGKVNIASEQSLSKSEVYQVFKDVMRVNNYVVTPTGNGEYRISLLQNSAQDAPLASRNGVSGRMSTVVLKMDHSDAGNIAKLIRPVVHSQGRLSANPGGKILVMTDFPENIAKARAIIEATDQDTTDYRTVSLEHMSPQEAEAAMRTLQGARPEVTVVAIPSSRSVVLQGPADKVAKLVPIIRALDRPAQKPSGNISVIPLRFANGEEMASIIANLLPSYAVEGQPEPTVAHETGSNSIIISAPPEVQEEIRRIIAPLDKRRPQVLVEALIVEISDAAANELGVQFGVTGLNDSSGVPFFTSNFSRSAPNLVQLTGALAVDSLGISEAAAEALQTEALGSLTGLNGGTFGFGTRRGDTVFSAIINAVETDVDSNVLSTPFVTTLDNVPASFLVGQEIPIVTGESLGSNNTNPFRSIERQDVGIKLDVTPQISEGDVIRLDIAQEVSSIDSAISADAGAFVTNKREIATTVLADNGEIIVLGGLLQDDEEISVQKIPLLGDAPVLGPLFRSKGRERTKRNLMVFLRPTIIRSSRDARPLTQERLELLRRLDMEQSGRLSSKIDNIFIDPVNGLTNGKAPTTRYGVPYSGSTNSSTPITYGGGTYNSGTTGR